jgi:hypothetical protein
MLILLRGWDAFRREVVPGAKSSADARAVDGIARDELLAFEAQLLRRWVYF